LITATATGSEARVLATRKQPDGFWLFRSGPVWSPDGSAIACAAAVPGTQGAQMSIVVVQLSDGSERTIGSARWSRVGRIAWLPDGSGLIMTASADRWSPWQIWHLSYPDGAARRLTNDINHYSDVSVTADGRMLVAVQAGGLASLWVGPASRPGAAKQITSEVERYDGTEGIAWLPNGKLLHRTKLAGNWDIVLIDPESGGQQRVTFDASSELHPAVSADGRQLVFSSDRSGRFHLWRTSLERGEVVQLTDGPDEEVYPEISRDGQWIVYQEGFAYFKKASIWRVLATGGKPQRLVPATTTIQPARGQYIRPAVSPDGRLVAYFQLDHRRWAIAVTPLNGGPPIGTFDIPPTASRILRWSPDGAGVAYIVTSRRVSNVWVQPIAGGPAHPFTEYQADRIFDFAWSQDGRRLAILRGIEASDLVSIAVSRPQ
jgi:Tol biopolymer transport system component